MVATGDVVYLVCRGRSGRVRLRGRVVDLEGEEVVVGFEKDPGISLPHSAGCPPEAGDLGKLSFVKVPAEAVSTALPAGWGTRVGGSAPSFEDALAAWEIVSKTVEKLESSEAEAQVQQAPQSKPAQESGLGRGANKKLEAELLEMSKSLFGGESEDSEDSEEEEDAAPPRKSKSGHLAPGASSLARSSSGKEGRSKSKTQDDLLQQMMVQQMSQGKSSNELMPLMMMMFMQQQQQQMKGRDKGRKSRKSRGWDALGSSSSESFKRRRCRQGCWHESSSLPSEAQQSHQEEAPAHSAGVRERSSTRTWCGGGPGLVSEGLVEEAAMGKVQGALQGLHPGRCRLRVHPFRMSRSCGSTTLPEHEVKTSVRSGWRRLVERLVAMRLGRSIESQGVGRLQGVDGHHCRLHQQPSQTQEEGQRVHCSSCGGDRGGQVNPLKSVHVPWKRGKYPWERGPNSRFLRYYAWLCDTHGTLLERSSSEGSLSLFPAALPFPELLAEGDASRVDEPNTLWAKSFINMWIGWSNYVVLGCPDCGDSACEPRVGYRQWKEVRTLGR